MSNLCAIRNRLIVLMLLAGPLNVCVPRINAQSESTQSSARLSGVNGGGKVPSFIVASIKPCVPGTHGWRIEFTPDGFSARGVTVLQLVEEAYRIFEADRIVGGTEWINSQKYDIDAKVDDADVAALQKLDLDQRGLMLQALLSERFNLVTHRESKERPIYALVIAKGGPRLQETRSENVPERDIKGVGGTVSRSRPGQLTVVWFTMAQFAQILSQRVDRLVVDETGLTGHYDFALDWGPDESVSRGGLDPNSVGPAPLLPPAQSGESIFAAIPEQLGLRLEAKMGTAEVLIIDRVGRPSQN